ncbi:MAG: thiamine-phosphate kinase [Rhodocyclaceae bacterium]
MPGEFDLIRRRFTRSVTHTDLGVGDDGALFTPRAGMQMVVSTDMLVSGTHFFADVSPELLGWKAAAVNISDMAAMGAEPRWMLLALSLPHVREEWVAAMASGFHGCCAGFGVDWVGGDTTRGPLNLCPTIIGEVPHGRAIVRSGARAGDDIWVSGVPGLAALGLRALRDNLSLANDWRERCISALHKPTPRVALGMGLRGLATAALDVSDGLCGDLMHILERSNVAAVLSDAEWPLQPLIAACGEAQLARQMFLAGGDDYELLFTIPAERRAEVEALSLRLALPLARIGAIEAGAPHITLRLHDGTRQPMSTRGFDHFS